MRHSLPAAPLSEKKKKKRTLFACPRWIRRCWLSLHDFNSLHVRLFCYLFIYLFFNPFKCSVRVYLSVYLMSVQWSFILGLFAWVVTLDTQCMSVKWTFTFLALLLIIRASSSKNSRMRFSFGAHAEVSNSERSRK